MNIANDILIWVCRNSVTRLKKIIRITLYVMRIPSLDRGSASETKESSMYHKLLLVICVSAIMFGCSRATVDGGEEVVFVKQPMFFGYEGVVDTPLKDGASWRVFTTKAISYDVKPIQYKQKFVDLTASDNVAIDFDTYLILKIADGKSPLLHSKFGIQWYKNNIHDKYREIVRNTARAKSSIELRTNPSVIESAQEQMIDLIREHLESEKIPVRALRLTIGKVVPPQEVLDESANTAAQKQRKQSQDARKLAEDARAYAEKSKALADKAFANEFKMTTEQFLRNKELDIMQLAIESDSKVTVIINASSAQPIFSAN